MNHMFQNNSVLVLDNFFNDFSMIAEHFKKIPIYTRNDFPEKKTNSEQWPGKRSENLFYLNPFICSLFLETTRSKIGINRNLNLSLHTHLRTEDTDLSDFCHQDNCFISGLVYLSDTNLNSGTKFYDCFDGEVISTINFVQNRAVFFSGKIWHRTFGAYGTDINNGRLTLNSFISS